MNPSNSRTPHPLYSGPWDLEIPTNAVIFERPPIVTPHPHPDIETMRAQLTNKLRQTYQELCHSREGVYHGVKTLHHWEKSSCGGTTWGMARVLWRVLRVWARKSWI